MDDRELLDEFVQRRSQGAFCELVNRHLPMVYSSAKRRVHDGHLAEEVAQAVFATLAQKAESTAFRVTGSCKKNADVLSVTYLNEL